MANSELQMKPTKPKTIKATHAAAIFAAIEALAVAVKFLT